MGLDVKLGTFLAIDGPPTQAITGVGFQPTFVLFWSVGTDVELNSTDQFARFLFGMSDSVNQYSVGYNSGRTATGTNCLRTFRDSAYNQPTGNQNNDSSQVRFDVQSMDPDGFTILHTDTRVDNHRMFYLAFGGTDIVNHTIGAFNGLDGPGVQEIELGYKPDFVLIFGTRTPIDVDDSGKIRDAVFSLGMATESNQTCIGCSAISDLERSHTKNMAREEMIGIFGEDGDELESQGFLNSLYDTGFTIEWERSVPGRYAYLAVEGILARIGGVNSPDRATQRSLVGVGFRPVAMMTLLGAVTPSTPALQAGATYALGAVDGIDNYVVSINDADGRDPETARREHREAMVLIQESNGINRSIAVFDRFEATGASLNWLTADPPGLRYSYVAFGTSEPVTPAVMETEDTIILTHEGQKIDRPIRVAAMLWTGTAAKGHRIIAGESSVLGNVANTLLELTCDVEGQTIPFPLQNVTFNNGLEVAEIDSGILIIYKDHGQVPEVFEVSGTGDTPVIAAPGVGYSIYVHHIHVSSEGLVPNANLVGVRAGVGGLYGFRTMLLTAGAATTHDANDYVPPWQLPDNTALIVSQTQANTLLWTIHYQIAQS